MKRKYDTPLFTLAQLCKLKVQTVKRIFKSGKDTGWYTNSMLKPDFMRFEALRDRAKPTAKVLLDDDSRLVSVPLIRKTLLEKEKLKISERQVRQLLMNTMGQKWRKVRLAEPYVNSRKNLLLRQMFARRLIEI